MYNQFWGKTKFVTICNSNGGTSELFSKESWCYQGSSTGQLFYHHNPQKPNGFHSSEMQLVFYGIE
jgi:hypothetical protein